MATSAEYAAWEAKQKADASYRMGETVLIEEAPEGGARFVRTSHGRVPVVEKQEKHSYTFLAGGKYWYAEMTWDQLADLQFAKESDHVKLKSYEWYNLEFDVRVSSITAYRMDR